MPRGVAIDGARQRMFAAAEAVILRDGAGGLRGRAITAEAGVATGLLHNHFGDFDGFLVAYAVDRGFLLTTEAAAHLAPGTVGRGTVAEELCAGLGALPRGTSIALARLLAAHPDLRARSAAVLGADAAGFAGVTAAVAARLTAERDAGRLRESLHPESLAYALVAALLRAWCTEDTDWRQLVGAVVDPVAVSA